MKKGRVNELQLGIALYFMNGVGEGVKIAMGKQKLGMSMMKTGRMSPMEALGGHALKDLRGFQKAIAKAQELAEAGLKLKNKTPIKHMAEVLIEGIGYDTIGDKVRKPLEGVKIAGYVGCRTNRPFGISGESYENPKYLDKLVDILGADSIPDYEKKVQCCGGALAFSEPAKSQEMVKGIIEAAYDHGADMIVTPCPVRQMNVEVYQDDINAAYGTKFKMPVVYYSTLMSVAYGRSAKDAALNGRVIPAKKLEELALK